MKTNATILNQCLTAMRDVIAGFRADLVAPKLLKEEGWDTSEIELTDEDVATLFRGAGVKLTKGGFTMSTKQGQTLCTAIDCLLSLRYMVSRGWLETAIVNGKESFRASAAGAAHCTVLRTSAQ